MTPPLPRWLLTTTLVCLCVLVIGFTAYVVAWASMRVVTITAALVAALLLTALLEPATRWLTSHRVPAWLASLGTMIAAISLIVGVFVLLVMRAVSQLGDLRQAAVDSIQKLDDLVLSLPFSVSSARLDAAESDLVDTLRAALPNATTGASVATQVVSGLALTVFLWFFLLKDGSRMWQWALGWVPRARVAAVDRGGRASWAVVTRYVRGTVVIALIDALGIGAGMLALGNPLTASLTCVVFLGAFVPIVGAFVSGALAVGVTLVTVGAVQALTLLAVVLAVQQIEGNLLQPWVMGQALQMHPVAIVLAVSVGALLGGVLGAVVAVPLVAVGYRLARDRRARSPGSHDAQGSHDATGATE